MSLVEIANLYDPLAAEIMRGRLAAAGIEAVVFDAGIASLIGPGLSGVRLMVDEADAGEARALLDSPP